MDNQKAIEYFYRQMELGNIKNDTEQEVYELAIYALEKQLNDKWIPVSEKLPAEDQIVLAISDDKYQSIYIVALRINGEWKVSWNHDSIGEIDIKAWRPLPEPYKEE